MSTVTELAARLRSYVEDGPHRWPGHIPKATATPTPLSSTRTPHTVHLWPAGMTDPRPGPRADYRAKVWAGAGSQRERMLTSAVRDIAMVDLPTLLPAPRRAQLADVEAGRKYRVHPGDRAEEVL